MSEHSNPIRKRIIETASEVFRLPVDVVERGISPDSVKGWDSVKHVEFVVALEDHFGCMFEVEEIPELISLGQIEEVVTRHAAGSDN
jgi:acyl carrier protein